MGAETLAIAAIAAAAVGTATSAATTIRSNSYAKHSAEEAAAEAYDRQNAQYENYLSPQAKADAYRQAGINPAAAVSQLGSSGMGSVQQAQIPSMNAPNLDFGQQASYLMSAVQSLSDTKLKDSQVREVLAEARYKDMLSEYQQTQNFLLSKYGSSKYAKELRDLDASAMMKFASGAQSEAMFDYFKALQVLTSKDCDIKDVDLGFLAQMYQMRLRTASSIINANNSQARLSRASAANQEFMNSVYNDSRIRENLQEQIILATESARRVNKISSVQADLIKEQVENWRKANSNYEIQMWSNIINQTINTAANAAGEFTKFGVVKQFMKSGKDSPQFGMPAVTYPYGSPIPTD